MPITSIDHNQGILNYINQINLNFSKPQLNHLSNLMTGIISIDGKRNISNICDKLLNSRERSCVTKFLNTSPWSKDHLDDQRISHCLSSLKPKANEPIFFAIDDTVIPKSKDTKHIEGLGYHFSHVQGKSVWSHCIVSSQVITDKYSLPLGFKQYLKKDFCNDNNLKFNTKIDIATNLIDQFNRYNCYSNKVYTLTDSWFTSKKVIDKSLSLGYHLIGGLKTNRCIYPKGIKIKVSKFVDFIKDEDLDTVNIKGKSYYVYRYEGKVSKIDNCVVLICWEKQDSSTKATCILSTDIELDTKTILSYYSRRWSIETCFLYLKDRIGLKHYQMRKLKGLNRFWSIVYLAYTYLELCRAEENKQEKQITLGDIIRYFKGVTFKRLVDFIYNQARNHVTLNFLYKTLKLET